jgi:hypothetical protein
MILLLASVGLASRMMATHLQSGPLPELASAETTGAWLLAHKDERLVIATDTRGRPVTSFERIPARWLSRPSKDLNRFSGTAQPGEFYTFQVSVVNNGPETVTIQTVEFSGLPTGVTAVCLNQAVSQDPGRTLAIHPGRILPLWIGIETSEPGLTAGSVEITTALGESGTFVLSKVPIQIKVSGPPVMNHGVDEGWRLARLKWLLPTDLGEASVPTRQFKPVERIGPRIKLTSTAITLGPNGLPSQIESLSTKERLLASPVRLVVATMSGDLAWSVPRTTFDPDSPDRSTWRTVLLGAGASLAVEGEVSFDGFVRYRLTLKANQALDLDDIRLEVPYRSESSRFQLGLGYHGGYTPAETDWKWNVAYQQDCVWLGDVPVGAQWRFKGSNYQRPLVNIYYGFRPLRLPDSWGNGGLGGIHVNKVSDSTRLLRAYSGARRLEAGQSLEFNFDLQITPSRPIDTDRQWSTRFYHPNELSEAAKIDQAVDTARDDGANVINVHHRKPVNPFINYPFNDFSVPDLKRFVASAHAKDIRVKLYYTTRELTWQLPEIWALKSFGESIIEPGPGPKASTVINPNGAHPLLAEALGDDFIPAWTAQLDGKYAGKLDLAVITRPDSAWTNYYLNGLEWLVKNVQIDGTYIDDTALDRTSLQRARRILEAGRPSPLIDLHSWNHEDPLAARGSSTSIYMELFPYVDRIWFGEGFDYRSASPDYWLIAMSGLPYGVMSEMLQGGGNAWRGMLFGETCRLGWSGDPRSMWKFWDRFGMAGVKMVGWWDRSCPVKTDSEDVLATAYLKPGKALIAIANWTNKPLAVNLKIDWKALGIGAKAAKLLASEIEGFQPAASWKPGDTITVPAEKGWLIVIE